VRAVVQRVTRASVDVAGERVARIGCGLLALIGVAAGDTDDDAVMLARKIAGLRVFDDEAGAMNLALADVGGEVLVVSQFTLLGDARKGRRPSFAGAARGDVAQRLYERVAGEITATGITVRTGVFGADMAVELVNDGPVTILLDTRRAF
jgi:D-tyrosyl-tRNA(Tyr) deacylase